MRNLASLVHSEGKAPCRAILDKKSVKCLENHVAECDEYSNMIGMIDLVLAWGVKERERDRLSHWKSRNQKKNSRI